MHDVRLHRFPSALVGLLFLSLGLAACGPTGRFLLPVLDENAVRPPDSTLAFSLYLVGDAGAPQPGEMEPALKLLKTHLDSAGANSGVVFLGDNIYPSGLPPTSSPFREEAERRILVQLKTVEDFKGRVVFVPGNHDWGGEGFGGVPTTLMRQEDFVESVLDRGDTFVPDNAFPGPVEIPLADSLLLIALDTQWWLEDRKTYGDTGQYLLEEESSVLIELSDILYRNRDKKVVVVAHHPLFTNGSHGGRYREARRRFPLYMMTRRYLGTPQDLSNLKYRTMRNNLLAVFEQHEGLVYAAGHDHNLQYFPFKDQHYIVSGAGSKSSFVAKGNGAAFADEGKGFGVLRYFTDGSVWLQFLQPEGDGATGKVVYEMRLEKGNRPLVAYEPPVDEAPVPDPAPLDTTNVIASTDGAPSQTNGETPAAPTDGTPYAFHSLGMTTVVPSEHYEANALKKLFLGERYRKIWSTPVEVPIIDLAKTAGGLTPIKRGGGLQTKSLRLQGADGDQYVLRTVDKDPVASVPVFLRKTLAQDIVRDQISAINPFAALAVPLLAEAAGIYHTAPRLVYVPDDPRLGPYRDEFAGVFALFETRPDEDQSDEARFGNATNVIGSPRLFEKIQEDNDFRMDERALARARLFDMFIGDWDRHKDQWRWAEFEPYELDPTLEGEARTQGKVYRPIPRDRDFAFFKFDGPLALLVRLAGRPEHRRYSNFSEDYGNLYGLNYNGAALDRRFTSSLTRKDWIEIAESLRDSLTDEAIEAAIGQWPEPIQEEEAARTIGFLKARREKLPDVAAQYYDKLLARIVDVIGSDKHELFEVTRLNDDSTLVVVYKTNKEGEVQRELFRRTFFHDETKEVRLYGLAGDDQFEVTGTARRGLLVRAIGGEGEDRYIDESDVKGGKEMTVFYDSELGNTWQVGPETDVHRSDEPGHNTYQMLRFETSNFSPTSFFGYNTDDGVFLGGGLRMERAGFRKSPYAASHELAANYAFRTNAYNVHYKGQIIQFWGDWDAWLDATWYSVYQFSQFYGLGNGTDLSDRNFFRSQIQQFTLSPTLHREWGLFSSATLGPYFSFVDVGPREEAFPTRFTPDDFTDKYFAGFQTFYQVDGTDTLANTQAGGRFLAETILSAGVRNTDALLARLRAELSYFYTFNRRRQTTLGIRVGGATNVGDFEFYQANTLGGLENLRGYRRTRFAGRHSFFTNVELRATLVDFNAYITRGEGGLLVFLDNGRVWGGDERSDVWHQGYGGGVWITPFHQIAVTATVARSPESTLFDLSFGFFF